MLHNDNYLSLKKDQAINAGQLNIKTTLIDGSWSSRGVAKYQSEPLDYSQIDSEKNKKILKDAFIALDPEIKSKELEELVKAEISKIKSLTYQKEID